MAKNKGEWSEAYAFFKLLIDEELKNGDAKLEHNGKSYKVLKLTIGADTENKTSYIPKSSTDEVLIIREGGKNPEVISRKVIRNKIQEFFDSILVGSEGERAFEIPIAEELLEYTKNPIPKAPSRDKADVIITIHDDVSNTDPSLGFSIKSQVGQASTLLNPSEATKFTYLIEGDLDAEAVNAIDGPIARVQEIYRQRCHLKYLKMKNETFEENLRKIDSYMPEILSEALILRFRDSLRSLDDIAAALGTEDIPAIHFEPPSGYFALKLKNLLLASSTGMVPGTKWEGSLSSLGGILIVRRDGELICYLITSIDLYSEYLFNATCLETPSSSVNKYDYAKIYEENGKNHIDLCLQVRFLR